MGDKLRCGECKKVLTGKPNDYPEIEVKEGEKQLFCVDCADAWIKAQQNLNNKIGEQIIDHIDEDEFTGNLLEDIKQAVTNMLSLKKSSVELDQIRTIINGELAKIEAGAEIDPEDTFITLLAILDGNMDNHNEEEEEGE